MEMKLTLRAVTAPIGLLIAISVGATASAQTRDLPDFRDPAVLMVDQLREVYIDGELEMIDTTNWLPKVMRKDYIIGFSPVAGGPTPTRTST